MLQKTFNIIMIIFQKRVAIFAAKLYPIKQK